MISKDAQIIAQTAAKVTADLLPEGSVEQFPVYLKAVADAIVEVAKELTTQPDTSVVVAPGGNGYPQAVQNLAAAGIATAPAAPQGDDELWQYFVQNRDEFYDNRSEGDTTVSGGSKPDFRAKNLVDKSGRKQGLFLVSRRYNKQAPDYVWEALGQAPPGAAPQVPAPTAAAPAPPAAAPF